MTFIRNEKFHKYTAVAEGSCSAESFRYELENGLISEIELASCYDICWHICSLSIHQYLSGGLRVAVTVSKSYSIVSCEKRYRIRRISIKKSHKYLTR